VFWWSIWFLLITQWKFCHCSLLSLLLCIAVILVSFRAVRRDAKSGYWLCQVCLSVCLSVRIEQLSSNWTDFYEIWYLRIILNMRSQNSSFIKIWKEKRVLYMTTCGHFWSYLAQFFWEWEMFHTQFVDKIKTHILCSVNFFPPKIVLFMR